MPTRRDRSLERSPVCERRDAECGMHVLPARRRGRETRALSDLANAQVSGFQQLWAWLARSASVRGLAAIPPRRHDARAGDMVGQLTAMVLTWHICRHRSMPDAAPAEVSTLLSSTNSASGSSSRSPVLPWVAPQKRRLTSPGIAGTAFSCVDGGWPSSGVPEYCRCWLPTWLPELVSSSNVRTNSPHTSTGRRRQSGG